METNDKKNADDSKKPISKPTTTDIDYSGKVSFRIKKGKKTLLSYKSHNLGKGILFKFIANALAGSFVPSMRPCKIKLFSGDSTESISDPNFEDKNDMSAYIMLATTPTVSMSSTGEGYSIKYHFSIPNAYIDTTKGEVYKLAIYPESPESAENGMCAYFLFLNEDEWNPQSLEPVSGNYVVLIDWEMQIGNKTAQA